MTAVELLLLDLVGIAETPLYSSYRWLDRRLSHKLSLTSFLAFVDGLLASDVVRLWSVDARTGDRTELYAIPESLLGRYSDAAGLDETFDPFGLSLTLGAAAPDDLGAEPEWSFDLDAPGGFELRAPEGIADAVLRDVEAVLSDLILRRSDVRHISGGQLVIRGTVEQRSASKP